MKNFLKRKKQKESGQALAEFAICLPLLIAEIPSSHRNTRLATERQ